jgi:hypothetical protein
MSRAAIRIVPGYDQLYADWLAKAPADGLPVVPPTPPRLSSALEAMGLQADDVVGSLHEGEPITAHDVALHAVLAGCRPEYMPVVLAAARAFLADGARRAASFAESAQTLIVNGPIRKQIDINCRDGLLGPGWRANATIGRALQLLLSAALGASRSSTFGDPGQYTFCFGEDEEGTKWAPLHVDAGLRAEQSAVTLHSTPQYKQMMFRSFPANGREIVRYIALFLRGRASGTDWFGDTPLSILLILGHELRRYLEAEWPDKAQFRGALYAAVHDAGLPGHRVNLNSVDDLAVVAAGGVAYPTAWALVSPGLRPQTRVIQAIEPSKEASK